MTRRGALKLGAGSLLAGAGSIRAETGGLEPLAVTEIAAGVFVHHGVHELASAGNHGGIANVGFVVGADAVAVIDSGSCAHAGERCAVRAGCSGSLISCSWSACS